jgi:hypothetical protein
MDTEATLVSEDRIRNPVESDRKKGLRWPVAQDIKNQLQANDDQVQVWLKRVMTLMHRLNRPCYAGAIAIEVGVSLRTVDLLITILCDAGELQPASLETLKTMGLDPGSSIYELVGPAQPWLAHD